MILIEENFENVEALVESVGGKKKTYLSGVFMEAETKNRNGRIYERSDLQTAVDKINEAAKLKRHILGHCDHPSHLEIRLEDVAMKLTEAKMVNNQVMCKAEILENHPKGQILKSLIESDVSIGVSSRGSGQVNESSGRVSNFNFVTVDAVATPSCRSAYPETVMEQLQMYKRGEIVNDLAEAVIHDNIAQKYFQMEMKKFIDSIKTK